MMFGCPSCGQGRKIMFIPWVIMVVMGFCVGGLWFHPAPPLPLPPGPVTPPHLVKVTIKYDDATSRKDGSKINLVDTEDGQRCTLDLYWGCVGDSFYVSSDKLGYYFEAAKELPTSIPVTVHSKDLEP